MLAARRSHHLTFLALAVALAAGCHLDVQLGVDVHSDGSGRVSVGVALDDSAVREAGPNLKRRLQVADLRASGWTVTGPTRERDGNTWIRASKPFATPDEATRVLAEINGPRGPLRGFRITRDHSFAHTRWRFSGTFDFRAGLAGFSDRELTSALDGEPVGESTAAIERRLHATIDRLVGMEVVVRLPGSVSANAPVVTSNGAAWKLSLADRRPVSLRASGSEVNAAALTWIAIAVAAGVAFVVVVAVQITRRRRYPRA